MSGMLCDKKIHCEMNEMLYRLVIRLCFNALHMVLTKKQGKKMDVTEMRMLRWIIGVTKRDKVHHISQRKIK